LALPPAYRPRGWAR